MNKIKKVWSEIEKWIFYFIYIIAGGAIFWVCINVILSYIDIINNTGMEMIMEVFLFVVVLIGCFVFGIMQSALKEITSSKLLSYLGIFLVSVAAVIWYYVLGSFDIVLPS